MPSPLAYAGRFCASPGVPRHMRDCLKQNDSPGFRGRDRYRWRISTTPMLIPTPGVFLRTGAPQARGLPHPGNPRRSGLLRVPNAFRSASWMLI